MAKDSSCLPFVSILVSLSVPNLSPYFSISIAIQFFSLGAFGQRNLLVSRSSLLSPLLSVLRSGGFGDRTQVPSVLVLVSLLHSHMWLFSLGASGAQYAPCPLVLSNSCPYFSLSLLLFFSLGAYLDTWFSLVPHLSSLVLVCSLQHVSLIPSSLLLLLGKERISWPLVFLLNFSSFVQVTFPYPRSLPHVTLLTFLLVSLSSLHYRASFQVSGIWDGEDSFSPLSFLSFLVPVVFPSAFFTSLLIPVVLAFGTQDSPCLPCVPICVLIQPIFSYLLLCLGFRTSSFLFVPPCYCSSSWVLLGTGYSSWLFVVLDGKGFFLPPICFHTCLLVCSQLVSLFFYLHCDSSLRVLLVKGISSSPVPLSPLLSGLRSGGFGDRTQVSSVFVLVSLLHSHMWLLSLGASGGQYAPCPLSVSVLIPLVLSNSCPYFSLSLSLSRCSSL